MERAFITLCIREEDTAGKGRAFFCTSEFFDRRPYAERLLDLYKL